MKGHEFKESYHISYFDVDKNQNLKIPTLLDMCSNTSTLQSEFLNKGLSYFEEHKATWIFCKMKLEIKRLPKFMETITINTYSAGCKKYFASRHFEIYDEKGEQIAFAQGLYCLLHTETRRPVPIPDDHIEAYGNVGDTVVLRDLKLKPLETYDLEDHYKARFSNIDTNGHVNNTVYTNWGLDSLPFSYLNEKKLKTLGIVFEKEVMAGQEVTVKTKLEGNLTEQALFNKEGQVTTLLRFEFED